MWSDVFGRQNGQKNNEAHSLHAKFNYFQLTHCDTIFWAYKCHEDSQRSKISGHTEGPKWPENGVMSARIY